MSDFNIVIEVNDWKKEYDDFPHKIESFEDAVERQVSSSYSVQEMARMIVVGRELGDIEENIIPPNKCILATGASVAYSQKLVARKKNERTPSGKKVRVREYVGQVNTVVERTDDEGKPLPSEYVPANKEEAKDAGFKRYDTPAASRRAKTYLLNTVPSHIKSRLNIIAVNGGDVVEVAELLKQKIDEIVVRLT